MARDFLVKDIAFQAGVSTATVDRVLNDRPGVRRQTSERVRAAIRELEQQESGASVAGRRLAIDIVIEAPERFSRTVRDAFEAEASTGIDTAIRCRFHLAEVMRPADIVQMLDRIRLRGTHGVVLKAPDLPEIAAAVTRLEDARIPVVTLVTDISHAPRTAYVGLNNRAAGETAAYLIGEHFAGRPATVLVTLSSNRFRGEEEREIGFRHGLRSRYPNITLIEISEGHGTDAATLALAEAALDRSPAINAVYSIGGGNAAVIAAFEASTRHIAIFVAHDLDAGNIALLRQGKLHFVLHHDLRSDARAAFATFLACHATPPRRTSPAPSGVQIITPFNLP